MSLKSASFPKELWIKPFISRTKQFKKKSETRFCRKKTEQDNNAKINAFQDVPSTFLLFKASAFLQISFPRNLLFRQVLKTSVTFCFPLEDIVTFFHFKELLTLGLCVSFTKRFTKYLLGKQSPRRVL